MLTVASVALALAGVPPVPVPRPDTEASVGNRPQPNTAPEQGVAPPPRDFGDKTVLEIILQDLEGIGTREVEINVQAPDVSAETPSEQPLRETASAVGDRAPIDVAAVPIPAVRPIVLAPDRHQSGNLTGGLCGDPRLSGTMISPVRGKIAACGIGAPVRITAVDGIKMSTPATLRCDAARTFADWVSNVANPSAVQDLGAPISSVWVMASYSCRTRNHRKGARLSEHSFGSAIDVGGFDLANGRKVTVLENWNKGSAGRFLRRIWRQACGPFRTVLGPQSDRYHRNHFHLDIAKRRSSFCR